MRNVPRSDIEIQLSKVLYYLAKLKQIDERIAEATVRTMRVTASYNFENGQNRTFSKDKMAGQIGDIDKLERQRNAIVKLYFKAILEVESLIAKLEPLEKFLHISVLRQKYLGGLRWNEIADVLELSERRVFQLHKEAIKILEALEKENPTDEKN